MNLDRPACVGCVGQFLVARCMSSQTADADNVTNKIVHLREREKQWGGKVIDG